MFFFVQGVPMLYQTHARVHLGNIRRNIEGIRQGGGTGPEGAHRGEGQWLRAWRSRRSRSWRSAPAWRTGWGSPRSRRRIELRKAGLRLPILKFSPAFPEEMGAAVENGVTLAVGDRANIEALQEVCKAKGLQARVHLKVDTGMGRVGVGVEEAAELAMFIERRVPGRPPGGRVHPPARERRAPADALHQGPGGALQEAPWRISRRPLGAPRT